MPLIVTEGILNFPSCKNCCPNDAVARHKLDYVPEFGEIYSPAREIVSYMAGDTWDSAVGIVEIENDHLVGEDKYSFSLNKVVESAY